MRPAQSNALLNLWKFVSNQTDIALRRAWMAWSNDMYIERALDWEQNYIQSAIIHPFLTNYAKLRERNVLREKADAFSLWAYNPAKRFLSGMFRMRKHTHNSLKDYIVAWRFKNKLVRSEKFAKLVHMLC
jgi:hypothetical protein